MKAHVRLPHVDARLTGDLSDFFVERPQLERLASVRRESKVVLAFMTWLEVIGCVIRPPKGVRFDLSQTMGEFFGVDRQKLEQEKRAIAAQVVKGLTDHAKKKS